MDLSDTSDAARHSVAERLEGFAEQLDGDELAALRLALLKADDALDTAALAALPPEELFDDDERELIAELDAMRDPDPLLPPKVTLIMKATRLCNLRCVYCNAWAEGAGQHMGFEVLARTIHGVQRDPGVRASTFVWHGGEPTLRGTDFYRRALWLQLRWRRDDQTVRNQLQTNATRLDPGFVEMCRRLHISVSVSLDGPPEIHDRQRLDAAGRPTSAQVRDGIEMLRRAGLVPGILMVVDRDTVELGAERMLDHLLELEVPSVGLLNAVPGMGPGGVSLDDPWLPWGTWQGFLRDLFRLWWPEHAGRLRIRELTELVRAVQGETARKCYYSSDCFSYVFTVEPDGDVTPCDKYVGDPDGRYGSVMEQPVGEVMTSPAVQARRAADEAEVDRLRGCRWFELCSGSCPFDRMVNRTRGADVPSGCCGLGPLLDEIAATVAGHVPAEAATASAGMERRAEPVAAAPSRSLPLHPTLAR